MNPFEKAVRKALIDKEMKMSELSRALGISNAYLYDILNSSRKAEWQKKRISTFLDLDYEKLMNEIELAATK